MLNLLNNQINNMTQHQIQIIIEQICDENPKEIKYSIRRKLFGVFTDLEAEHLKILAEKDAEIERLNNMIKLWVKK